MSETPVSYTHLDVYKRQDQGRIPYIQLGGKILYRQSDIERLLEENYHPALVLSLIHIWPHILEEIKKMQQTANLPEDLKAELEQTIKRLSL